jgi:hypothetical protein
VEGSKGIGKPFTYVPLLEAGTRYLFMSAIQHLQLHIRHLKKKMLLHNCK